MSSIEEEIKEIDLSNIEGDSEREKKYNQMKLLIQRGVTNFSLIAKTIGVDRSTVYEWKKRLHKDYEDVTDALQKKVEFGKMIDQLDMMIYGIWQEINNSNMTESKKVSAIVSSLAPLRMKAELFGFMKGKDPFVGIDKTQSLTQVNMNVYNYFTQLMGGDTEKVKQMLSVEELTGVKPI